MVRQRSTESGERLDGSLHPVKACVDPELLEILRFYELRKVVDAVLNEEQVAVIDANLGSVQNLKCPAMTATFEC
ncbi:hypothetical protein F442_18061 [Phytophthora nicotianae P10297]|uniref:Uncharacterized protein n=3 Tax=Phytophthora nicotianae TaxID=4792 RepID=W2YF32_PHYNI|nr:hypothetical protein L917_17475 [Phytophthora nicotianae]ETO64148.1 hypothetical protein F444_18242 [Phytophthora nicotianae P1976]ETP33407.1 hypothetical protein F442_18061 [Phytophthora nicotianae P10297]